MKSYRSAVKLNIVLGVMALILSFSCDGNGKKSAGQINEHPEPAHQHKSTEMELSLNKGTKWKTDESTRLHVNRLDSILVEFKSQGLNDLKNYKILAGDLKTELNSLIADCKMKGPEHDALHHWLLPVIHETNGLNKISSANEGKEKVQQLAHNVEIFNNYFEW